MSSTDPLSGAFAHSAWDAEDRYDVHEVVAQGGMGWVLRAWDRQVGRQVAIKRARADVPGAAARLRREAGVLAELQHGHVVPLLDADEDDEGFHLVLPWIEGPGLESLLGTAAGLHALIDVARALRHAHRMGIVHRDLKPANVLTHEGRAVLIDWGLAATSRSVDSLEPLTRTGTGVGTPGYMAPEQALGESAAPTVDVWAFGILLYRHLTGAPPPDAAAVWSGQVARGLPPGPLGGLVRACLTRDPAGRPEDGAALCRALEAATVPRTPRRGLGGVTSVVAVAAVAVMLAAGAAWRGARAPVQTPAKAERALIELAWTAFAEGRSADAQDWAAGVEGASPRVAGLDWLPSVPEPRVGELFPDCGEATILPGHTGVLCTGAQGVRWVERSDGGVRWSVEAPGVESRAVTDGVVVRDGPRVVHVDGEGRQRYVASVPDFVDLTWHDGHLIAWTGAKIGVARFAGSSVPLEMDRNLPVRTVPRWDPAVGQWVAGLFDDLVWLDPVSGAPTRRTKPFSGEDLVAVWPVADGVIALGCRGELTRLDRTGQVVSQRVLGDGGFVLAAQLDGTRIALHTAQSGVTVWETDTGAQLGQLVERDRRIDAFRLAGDVVAWMEDGRWFERRLPDAPVQVAVPGMSAFGGSGDHWAAAGRGRLVEITPPHRHVALDEVVTKAVAWWDDSWVVAQSPGQVVRLGDGAPRPIGPPVVHRDLVPLADGSLLTLPYHGGPYRLVGDTIDDSLARVEAFLTATADHDGRRVGLVAKAGRVYEVRVGEEGVDLRFITEHPGARLALPVPDGMWVVGDDTAVRTDGQTVSASWEVRQIVTAVGRIGERCLFGDLQGRIEVRSCASGALEAVIQAHDERVVAITARDGALWTASWDGHLRRLAIP
jgi:hypothetical protein